MSSGAMSRASGWWRIGIITGGYGCLGAGIKHDILVWREIFEHGERERGHRKGS